MANKNKLTTQSLTKLKVMYNKGKSVEEIARRLNLDVSFAQKHIDYLDRNKPKAKKPKKTKAKIAPDLKPDNPGADVTSGDA